MPTPAEIAQQARQLAAAGRLAEAEALLRRAAQGAPSPEVLAPLGLILIRTGRDPEAAACLQAAAGLAPGRPDIHYYLGVALVRLGRLAEAASALERSAQLAPGEAAGLELLGEVLVRLGEFARAEPVLARARQLAPGSGHIASLYGTALQMLARIPESARVMEANAAAHPDDPDARLSAAILQSYWEGGDPARIRAHLERRGRVLSGGGAGAGPAFAGGVDPARRLRVGFLCQDIRKDSAIARFVAAPLLHLDREQFEVRGYCTQPTMERMTARLRGAAPWVDVSRMDDGALLARLRGDGLDILVETIGNTPGNRGAVLAKRAAPVQVTCIGDPRTTGIPAMDYRVVDGVTDPEGTEQFCTEKLARLPGCFLCYEPHDDAPADRASAGPPGAPVSFASFNVPDKTGAAVVETWAAVLREVPRSRLVLRAWGFRTAAVQELYRERFRAHGIDPARVEFGAHHADMGTHLAQYHRVDIGLDPFPYNGTTTSCDCLWMGVPFVALRGAWHAARVGASLLTAVGLAELIAEGREEYVRLAVGLASDPARLGEMHRSLRGRMAVSPLGDAPAYAARLGEAYRAMWRERAGAVGG